MPPNESDQSGSARIKLWAGLAVILLLVASSFLLPTQAWLLRLAGWVRGAGLPGAALYAGVYVVGTVAFVPGSLLTLAAGFAYGPLWGTLLVWPSATIGSGLAFLVGRFLARDWVAKRIAGSRRFAAIDRAVAKSGFRIVLLLRLSPVFPFNFLNYALGLTRIGFWRYLLASFLGMLPGTAMYVYLGSLVTSASALTGGVEGGGAARSVLYWGGLVATVLVTVLVTRLARRELGKVVPAPDDPQ